MTYLEIVQLTVYNGKEQTGELNPELIREVVNCGFTPSVDFLDEEKAKALIWTFEEPR